MAEVAPCLVLRARQQVAWSSTVMIGLGNGNRSAGKEAGEEESFVQKSGFLNSHKPI
jgi:hypothetical protein